MTPVSIVGVGLLGPGLPGWEASQAVLTGRTPWQPGEVVLPPPAILPATERRRTGPVARLALAVASEAAAASGLPPASFRPVFGSSNGDAVTLGFILDAITRPDGFVSPTQFHNSVHNAAAGYWSIGTGSTRPATCVACYDWTFGSALMKAVAECAVEQEPVLLCLYDVPLPPPLDAKRPTEGMFAAAFVLAPGGKGPRIALDWDGHLLPLPRAEEGRGEGAIAATAELGTVAEQATLSRRRERESEAELPLAAELRPVALGNPAARALRLLEVLAQGKGGSFRAGLLDGALRVSVTA